MITIEDVFYSCTLFLSQKIRPQGDFSPVPPSPKLHPGAHQIPLGRKGMNYSLQGALAKTSLLADTDFHIHSFVIIVIVIGLHGYA